jgi:hypothetical protein
MPFASICRWSYRHHFSWAGWLRISRSLCTPLHLADATFIQKHAGQSTSRSEGSRAATAGNGARLAVSYIKTCLQRFGPVKSSYGRYGGHGCCAQWVQIGWWLGSITWPVCLVDAKGLKGSPWVTFAPCQKQALTFCTAEHSSHVIVVHPFIHSRRASCTGQETSRCIIISLWSFSGLPNATSMDYLNAALGSKR